MRADQLALFAGEYVPLRLPGSRAAEAHWARDYPQSPRRANSASIAHQHRPPAVHTFRATLGPVDLAHGRQGVAAELAVASVQGCARKADRHADRGAQRYTQPSVREARASAAVEVKDRADTLDYWQEWLKC